MFDEVQRGWLAGDDYERGRDLGNQDADDQDAGNQDAGNQDAGNQDADGEPGR